MPRLAKERMAYFEEAPQKAALEQPSGSSGRATNAFRRDNCSADASAEEGTPAAVAKAAAAAEAETLPLYESDSSSAPSSPPSRTPPHQQPGPSPLLPSTPPSYNDLRDRIFRLECEVDNLRGMCIVERHSPLPQAEHAIELAQLQAQLAAALEEKKQQQAQHDAQRQAQDEALQQQAQTLQLQAQAHHRTEHRAQLAEQTNAALKNQLAEAQAQTDRAQRETRKARTAEKKAKEEAARQAMHGSQPPSMAAPHHRDIFNLARPRYAFLVGIGSAYGREGGELHNTTNDVKDLGEKLASVGFNCISLIDGEATRANVMANLANLLRHVAEVDETIAKNGRSDLSVIVFYFSGHGRTSSKRRQQLCLPGKESLDLLDDVLKRIDARKTLGDREPANVVLLDCCRDSEEQVCTDPKHTSVVYSCRVPQLSSDGQRGRNGVFTEQLLARLTTGVGVPWGKIISETRKGVCRATSGRQDPTYTSTSSLVDALVLVPCRAANNQHERLIDELTKVDSRSQWAKFTASLGSGVQSAKAWLSSFLPAARRETFLPATSENAVGHRATNSFGIQLSKLYENTARFMRARPSAQDVEMEGSLRV